MFVAAITSLFALAFTAGIVFWLKLRRIYKLTETMPGPKAIAVLGNTLQFPTTSEEFYLYMENLCKTHKDSGFCRIWIGSHLIVLVYRADHIELFCNSTKNIAKSFLYSLIEPWLKNGLLLSSGEKWRSRRKMITSSFHFKILEEFLEVMNEQVQILVDLLEAKVGQGPFDVEAYIAHCTLDIICETAMGCHADAQRKQSNYVKAIHSITTQIIDRMRSPWLWWDTLFWLLPAGKRYNRTLKELHGFTRTVIKERSAEFDRQWKKMEGGNREATETVLEADAKPIKIGKRMAFLDMLLLNAKKDPTLNHEGIQEEVDTFMFAGHDTTAATAVWALYFIGKYPEIQAKLHQEVDKLFGDDDRPVSMEDLNHFKYLECVLKETMRLCPTVPMLGREFSEDCKIGGCFAPKGSTAIMMLVPLHRDPSYFRDPDKFDPDRWLTDNPTEKHPFSYIPFSAGPRNCMGQKFAMMEEKVLLGGILRRFKVVCHEADDIDRAGLVVLRPAKGLQIELLRRDK